MKRMTRGACLAAAWLGALAWAVACSSEPDDPVTQSTPRGGNGGNAGSRGGSGGSGNAGGGNGGEGGESCADAVPMTEVCPRDMTFGPPTMLPIAGDAGDLFGSITPDELHIAWMTGGEDDGVVHYADRSSADDDFDAPRELEAVEGFYALERVALSPDGLTLIAVGSDRLLFGAFTRESA